jgi:hypothetical protein
MSEPFSFQAGRISMILSEVHFTVVCKSQYEAAVLYNDLTERACSDEGLNIILRTRAAKS